MIETDHVYFMAEAGSDLDWLLALYEELGIRAEAEYVERAAGKFDIIRIREEAEE